MAREVYSQHNPYRSLRPVRGKSYRSDNRADRLLRGRLRDGFFVTLHHLEPTRFGEWAIRRADGTIADLLHELDDDIVIVTVVLLSLQRRESERAAC